MSDNYFWTGGNTATNSILGPTHVRARNAVRYGTPGQVALGEMVLDLLNVWMESPRHGQGRTRYGVMSRQ